MGPPATLDITESRTDAGTRLSLSGELDLASCAMLEDRLALLRATRSPVCLNLSRLEFIDSTGIHLLIRTVGEARIKHWRLEIEPDIHPQVMRMFKLVRLDRFVSSDGADHDDGASEADLRPVRPSAPAEPTGS